MSATVQPYTGYETLIYDCMDGDAILLRRADEIEAGWSVVRPILDGWGTQGQICTPILQDAKDKRKPMRFWAAMAVDGDRFRKPAPD